MKEKIAFTICTNSYLPQARILADSLKQWGPEYAFYVFLADEPDPSVDYKSFANVILKPAKELPIDFAALVKKYGIIELNTSIKASCFKWLFQEHAAEQVHFFDPDICFFSDIKILDSFFANASILVTPHITQPIAWQDGSPNENLFLNHGIYNLGYIGLKRSDAIFAMLNWWEENTLERGFYNTRQGFFVDQLWINYVPIFHQKETRVLLHKGFNMAPWNLHERKLSVKDGRYFVNEVEPLVFYHFSSFPVRYDQERKLSAPYRYTLGTNPDVETLYDEYRQKMLSYDAVSFAGKKWAYEQPKPLFPWMKKKRR